MPTFTTGQTTTPPIRFPQYMLASPRQYVIHCTHMDQMQFNPDEGHSYAQNEDVRPRESAMVRFIMKISGGMIKDEAQANYALLGIAALFFVGAIVIAMGTFGGPKSQPFPYQYREDVPEEIRAELPPEVFESLPSRGQ